ncbi:neuromedin U receptor activity protein [Homalodisca vitripennis]|nr:neuromedin U receptor activity protein [Homalodisca vitripennis]
MWPWWWHSSISWAPFQVQRLYSVFGFAGDDTTHTAFLVHKVMKYASGIFYYLSATINPILYNIMSLKFRQAFKDLLLSVHHHQSHPVQHHVAQVPTGLQDCATDTRRHGRSHAGVRISKPAWPLQRTLCWRKADVINRDGLCVTPTVSSILRLLSAPLV